MRIKIQNCLNFLSLIALFFSFSYSAFASEEVQLAVPNNGEIPTNNQALIVHISGVVLNNVGYNIVCHVNNMNNYTIISTRGLYCAPGKKVNPTCIPPANSIIVNGQTQNQPGIKKYFAGDNIVEIPAIAVLDSDPTGALMFATDSRSAQKTTVINCAAVPLN